MRLTGVIPVKCSADDAGASRGTLSADLLGDRVDSVALEVAQAARDVELERVLVEADGGSVAAAKERLRAAGALTPWKQLGDATERVGARPTTPPWARIDHRIRIYRMACPGASAPGAAPAGSPLPQ